MNTLFDAPAAPPPAESRQMILRPFQTAALDALEEAFSDSRSALIVSPTGTGKTIMFAAAIPRFAKKRAIVLVDTESLVWQTQQKCEAMIGVRAQVEKADRYASRFSKDGIVVASIQTLISGRGESERRMHGFNPNDFDFIIADEAHKSLAPSWRMCIDHFMQNPESRLVGFTATPDRADEQPLGEIYKACAFEYHLPDAIRDGWLVRILSRTVRINGLDLSKCRTTAGDLNASDLAEAVEIPEVVQAMCDAIERECANRKTLVFAVDVNHAGMIVSGLECVRPNSARIVTGETPEDERRLLYRHYADGEFQYLVNVGVLTTGYDEPTVEAIALCRATKSRPLFAQMVGRGTRALAGVVDGPETPELRRAAIAASGKPAVLVLDFAGNSGRHSLIGPRDILGGKEADEVVELAERGSKAGHQPADILDEIDAAKQELHERRHTKRAAAKQVATAMYSFKDRDPFEVLDIEPERERGWQRGRPITAKMKAVLDRYEIANESLSYGKAHQIIDAIVKRDILSPPIAKWVKRAGLDPSEFTQTQGKRLMAYVSSHNWQIPKDRGTVRTIMGGAR